MCRRNLTIAALWKEQMKLVGWLGSLAFWVGGCCEPRVIKSTGYGEFFIHRTGHGIARRGTSRSNFWGNSLSARGMASPLNPASICRTGAVYGLRITWSSPQMERDPEHLPRQLLTIWFVEFSMKRNLPIVQPPCSPGIGRGFFLFFTNYLRSGCRSGMMGRSWRGGIAIMIASCLPVFV
jgi:hypothetical protein